jgi:hypothetical protein
LPDTNLHQFLSMDYPSIVGTSEPIQPFGETEMIVRAIWYKVSLKLANSS